MELLFDLLALAAGLLLVAAGLIHLVDPRHALRLLGQLRVPLFVLLVAFVVFAVVRMADRLALIAGLLALSVVAYVVREYRQPKQEKRFGSGGIERTPIMPTYESQSERNEDNQEQ